MANKTKFIRAKGHVMVGNTGGPSDVLAPGERVPFIEDSASHKEIERQVKAGAEGYKDLEVVEVDLEAEQRSEKERQELLAKAEKIAAKARDDQAAAEAAAAAGGSPPSAEYDPTDHTVDEVLSYLKEATEEEVARVKAAEASSDRSSKQVADFGGGG